MFWWKTLQRKIDSFPLWFYDWREGKPFDIGKAAKPCCFKNIYIKKLPAEWESNKKAWIT
jgi:hypothetical protein